MDLGISPAIRRDLKMLALYGLDRRLQYQCLIFFRDDITARDDSVIELQYAILFQNTCMVEISVFLPFLAIRQLQLRLCKLTEQLTTGIDTDFKTYPTGSSQVLHIHIQGDPASRYDRHTALQVIDQCHLHCIRLCGETLLEGT